MRRGRQWTRFLSTGTRHPNCLRLYQQPIPCWLREAAFVLDSLLEHDTELDPRTCYTNTQHRGRAGFGNLIANKALVSWEVAEHPTATVDEHKDDQSPLELQPLADLLYGNGQGPIFAVWCSEAYKARRNATKSSQFKKLAPTESPTAIEVVVRPWSEAETFRLHFRLPVLA
jgi:Tn3 transposase DDE domain